MAATTQPPARARSFRLTAEDDAILARLVEHFSRDTPAGFRVTTPTEVFRLALRRLEAQELGPKKSSKKRNTGLDSV